MKRFHINESVSWNMKLCPHLEMMITDSVGHIIWQILLAAAKPVIQSNVGSHYRPDWRVVKVTCKSLLNLSQLSNPARQATHMYKTLYRCQKKCRNAYQTTLQGLFNVKNSEKKKNPEKRWKTV